MLIYIGIESINSHPFAFEGLSSFIAFPFVEFELDYRYISYIARIVKHTPLVLERCAFLELVLER